MVSNSDAILEAQKSIALKVVEPAVDADRPWEDDLLNRQEIATRLTNLVANQEAPLTVSLHGQWGTGKTFMLRRWQRDLEKDGYRAIYFNAWEDDFCDDPLLAFIGQLAEHFKATGFQAFARRAADVAIPLIMENLAGILRTKTGITFSLDEFKSKENTLLDDYLAQRASKDELKEALTDLAEKVATDTKHPLVFIVDELDRCRPTFAIELLERVKHIFDVQNIVFVFGLNRDELCKSLRSVYGEIDADVYLRRFFDFEFNLPEVGSQVFAESLIDKFNLGDAFAELSSTSRRREPIQEYQDLRRLIPQLWSVLGLSLRDIDYGVRLLAILTRSISATSKTHPLLLGLLIGLKFRNPELYLQLVTGSFRTREVMDYIDRTARWDLGGRGFDAYLDFIEGYLYCADVESKTALNPGKEALSELDKLLEGDSEYSFQIISRRARYSDKDLVQRLRGAIEDGQMFGVRRGIFASLSKLIDTHQSELRQ